MSLLPTIRIVVHTLRHALVRRVRETVRAATTRQRPLRIAVDIRPFYEPLTGIGWYLYYVLHEMAKDGGVELYLIGDARFWDIGPKLHCDLPANAHLLVFDLRGLEYDRIAHQLTAAAYVLLLKLAGCDVFFGANYFLPRLHAAIAKRRVVTVHDLTFKRFPELLQKETLENLDRLMTREIAIADAVICVSESTRRDLLQFYEADPRRVITIHSGLGTPPAAAPIDGLPARYLLFVSTVEPRKNLGVLLDAYEALRADGYDGSLVVVGRIGWKSEAIARRMKAMPGVVHLDYVSAPQLVTIYRNAEAFVFPSIYEGFGFPLLEAMAHGVPAISANSSSLPEIGGDAALYFDPRSSASLLAQLRLVLFDPALRAELIARGRARAAQFRWDTAAKQTLDVLRRAAE